jgi:hypothetical protein
MATRIPTTTSTPSPSTDSKEPAIKRDPSRPATNTTSQRSPDHH